MHGCRKANEFPGHVTLAFVVLLHKENFDRVTTEGEMQSNSDQARSKGSLIHHTSRENNLNPKPPIGFFKKILSHNKKHAYIMNNVSFRFFLLLILTVISNCTRVALSLQNLG